MLNHRLVRDNLRLGNNGKHFLSQTYLWVYQIKIKIYSERVISKFQTFKPPMKILQNTVIEKINNGILMPQKSNIFIGIFVKCMCSEQNNISLNFQIHF